MAIGCWRHDVTILALSAEKRCKYLAVSAKMPSFAEILHFESQ